MYFFIPVFEVLGNCLKQSISKVLRHSIVCRWLPMILALYDCCDILIYDESLMDGLIKYA